MATGFAVLASHAVYCDDETTFTLKNIVNGRDKMRALTVGSRGLTASSCETD